MRTMPTLAILGGVLLAGCGSPAPPTPVPTPTKGVELASTPSQNPTSPIEEPTVTPIPVAPSGFPDPEAYAWDLVASGFESPVDIQFPPDDSGRMFIVEQPGRIRIFDPSAPAAGPFLDITDRVNSRGNEQGLLGLAFHPQYAENGLFFVNYTGFKRRNVIARFEVSNDPDAADAGSELVLLSIDDPFANHNGGALAFGPDGYLYAALGDGGSGGDPFGNGQNTATLLGKILRLDVDRDEPYAIPEDNPYAQGGGSPEIWAYGLRNPWRISFDAANGDLYIGDVGQGTWEEVDYLPADLPGGANLGWNYREGSHAFEGGPPPGAQLVDPVAEYSHTEGGCSITGGYVYRGSLSEWDGIYLYGDYCTGYVWGLFEASGNQWQSSLLYQTGANITTFGQDSEGEVYLADRSGSIHRLELVR